MDMKKLMQQAQKLQKEMDSKNKELENKEFEFENNGIKIKMKGSMEVVDIQISKDAYEDRELLQDLLLVLINKAITEIEVKKNEIQTNAQQSLKPGMF